MDRQLAFATFATLIPVFLLAGVLSDRWFDLEFDRVVTRVTLGYLLVSLIGETVSIAGVSLPSPPEWLLFADEICVGTVSGTMFGAAFLAVLAARQYGEDGDSAANTLSGDADAPPP